jgi:hypothetical protein
MADTGRMEGLMTRTLRLSALALAMLGASAIAPASAQEVEAEIYGEIKISGVRSELWLVQYGQLPKMHELTRGQQVLVYAADNLIVGVGQVYYRTPVGWGKIFYRVPDTRELFHAFMTKGVKALVVRETAELPEVVANIGPLIDVIESFVVMPNGSIRLYPFTDERGNHQVALNLVEALADE